MKRLSSVANSDLALRHIGVATGLAVQRVVVRRVFAWRDDALLDGANLLAGNLLTIYQPPTTQSARTTPELRRSPIRLQWLLPRITKDKKGPCPLHKPQLILRHTTQQFPLREHPLREHPLQIS